MLRAHPLEIADFCKLLIASGLFTEESVKKLLEDFCSDDQAKSPFGHSLVSFTAYLVSTGTLTCWQCGKLCAGKHKGFILDGYALMGELTPSKDGHLDYLAKELATGDYYVLHVVPRSTHPPGGYWPKYTADPFVPPNG